MFEARNPDPGPMSPLSATVNGWRAAPAGMTALAARVNLVMTDRTLLQGDGEPAFVPG